jgi:hypothetical protein
MAKDSVLNEPGLPARIASDDVTTPMPPAPPSESVSTHNDGMDGPHLPGLPSAPPTGTGRPADPEQG